MNDLAGAAHTTGGHGSVFFWVALVLMLLVGLPLP